jgi:uncharacterized protein YdhG (YjbR/CyaY superfamily)
MKASEKTKAATVGAYLASVPGTQRMALEKLRRTILSAAPRAEGCISYGLPAFRLNGRPLVAFGAWADHCALYPMSGATVKRFAAELKAFKTTKGTIRFSAANPLPTALVRKLVRARVLENTAKPARVHNIKKERNT